MNAYQVIWLPSEWARLHDLWDVAADPDAVDDARLRIEDTLGADPHRNGTPLSEGLWRFESHPLRVFFSIDSPRRRVLIRYVLELP
jgi:hypothetical protein